MAVSCPSCRTSSGIDKGRAFDGRRAYRCQCGHIWTQGMQGRERRYSPQRPGTQFKDTGAAQHQRIVGAADKAKADFARAQRLRMVKASVTGTRFVGDFSRAALEGRGRSDE